MWDLSLYQTLWQAWPSMDKSSYPVTVDSKAQERQVQTSTDKFCQPVAYKGEVADNTGLDCWFVRYYDS